MTFRVMGEVEVGSIETIRHLDSGTKLNITREKNGKLLSRLARYVVPKGNFDGSGSDVTDVESSDDSGGMKDAAVDKLDKVSIECSYCSVVEKHTLVKCDTCYKFFCNGRGKTYSSHIVEHLVKSRHKTVSIEEGTKSIHCFSCGNRNVFEQGFVRAENALVILCRLPCSIESYILSMAKFSDWQPVIFGQMVQPCLVPSPNAAGMNITRNEIHLLENDWAAADFRSAESLVVVDPAAEVLLR